MNTAILQIIVSQFAAPLLAGFVMLARAQNPAGTDAAIADAAEGDCKHILRSKLGFLVDVIWGIPEFKSLLDTEIATAVSENALPDALATLLPTPAAIPAAVPAAPVHAEGVLTLGDPLTETTAGTFIQA